MFMAQRRQKKAMQATIAGIADDSVDLEIAPGVITTWMKLAIRDRILADDEYDDDDDDDDDDYESDDELTDADDVEEQAKADPAPSPKTDS